MIKERKELIREKERKQKLENIPNDIHGLWEFLDFRGVLNYIRFNVVYFFYQIMYSIEKSLHPQVH